MSFEQLLFEQYGIRSEEPIMVDNIKGYKKGEYVYFIIFAENKEIIHMEQATLAYFLAEQFSDYIAIPIPNVQGEWFTSLNESAYIVLQIKINDWSRRIAGGEDLAQFHQLGTTYNYEPQTISSYGQWRTLWINKLTYFEKKAETTTSSSYSKWNEIVNDALPYIIGVSENAIQYMQESEQERRFHENDQGSITFNRYYDQLERPFLWPTDLVYDHPVRDLAEKIRYMILNRQGHQDVSKFLHEYQAMRPLSVFSWRLLYARLLYPVHIFDCMDTGFTSENPDDYANDLENLLYGQDHYESFLKNLYEMAGTDINTLRLPVLHWL